jgi:uncharacterized protein
MYESVAHRQTRPRQVTVDELARGLQGRCEDPSYEARRLWRAREQWNIGSMQIHDRLINPGYLTPGEVDPEDIARALGHLCRFGGHVATWYSVASHSLHVSRLLPARLKLAGLLHDAGEAYIGGDIQRPLKHSAIYAGVRDLELYVDAIIALRFGIALSVEDYAKIKAADHQALCDEANVILHYAPLDWDDLRPPSDVAIHPENPYDAQLSFLARLSTLLRST